MKRLHLVLLALVAIAVILLVAAPIGPMPGVFIGGTETEAPATWSDTSKVDEILLKVPGPRVVIIWVIDVGGELYVLGSKESGWVQRIGEAAPVEMRLEGKTYALRATRVTEGVRPIFEAYVAKYEPNYPDIVAGLPPIDEAEGFAAIFRLDRS